MGRLVGPGRAIDTDRYFVICSNVLGGCQGSTGPASIDPATGRPYGSSFPVITIGDMVRAQARCSTSWASSGCVAVAGGSMGGMQTLEWAVALSRAGAGDRPHRHARRAPSPQTIAWNEVGRQAIMSDPAGAAATTTMARGPSTAWRVARMVGMITYQSDPSMWSEVRPAS